MIHDGSFLWAVFLLFLAVSSLGQDTKPSSSNTVSDPMTNANEKIASTILSMTINMNYTSGMCDSNSKTFNKTFSEYFTSNCTKALKTRLGDKFKGFRLCNCSAGSVKTDSEVNTTEDSANNREAQTAMTEAATNNETSYQVYPNSVQQSSPTATYNQTSNSTKEQPPPPPPPQDGAQTMTSPNNTTYNQTSTSTKEQPPPPPPPPPQGSVQTMASPDNQTPPRRFKIVIVSAKVDYTYKEGMCNKSSPNFDHGFNKNLSDSCLTALKKRMGDSVTSFNIIKCSPGSVQTESEVNTTEEAANNKTVESSMRDAASENETTYQMDPNSVHQTQMNGSSNSTNNSTTYGSPSPPPNNNISNSTTNSTMNGPAPSASSPPANGTSNSSSNYPPPLNNNTTNSTKPSNSTINGPAPSSSPPPLNNNNTTNSTKPSNSTMNNPAPSPSPSPANGTSNSSSNYPPPLNNNTTNSTKPSNSTMNNPAPAPAPAPSPINANQTANSTKPANTTNIGQTPGSTGVTNTTSTKTAGASTSSHFVTSKVNMTLINMTYKPGMCDPNSTNFDKDFNKTFTETSTSILKRDLGEDFASFCLKRCGNGSVVTESEVNTTKESADNKEAEASMRNASANNETAYQTDPKSVQQTSMNATSNGTQNTNTTSNTTMINPPPPKNNNTMQNTTGANNTQTPAQNPGSSEEEYSDMVQTLLYFTITNKEASECCQLNNNKPTPEFRTEFNDKMGDYFQEVMGDEFGGIDIFYCASGSVVTGSTVNSTNSTANNNTAAAAVSDPKSNQTGYQINPNSVNNGSGNSSSNSTSTNSTSSPTSNSTGSSTNSTGATGTNSTGTNTTSGNNTTATGSTGSNSTGSNSTAGTGTDANSTGTNSTTGTGTGANSTGTNSTTGTGTSSNSTGTNNTTGTGSGANSTGTNSTTGTGSTGTNSTSGTNNTTGTGSTGTNNTTGTGSTGTNSTTGTGSTGTNSTTGTGSTGTNSGTGTGSNSNTAGGTNDPVKSYLNITYGTTDPQYCNQSSKNYTQNMSNANLTISKYLKDNVPNITQAVFDKCVQDSNLNYTLIFKIDSLHRSAFNSEAANAIMAGATSKALTGDIKNATQYFKSFLYVTLDMPFDQDKCTSTTTAFANFKREFETNCTKILKPQMGDKLIKVTLLGCKKGSINTQSELETRQTSPSNDEAQMTMQSYAQNNNNSGFNSSSVSQQSTPRMITSYLNVSYSTTNKQYCNPGDNITVFVKQNVPAVTNITYFNCIQTSDTNYTMIYKLTSTEDSASNSEAEYAVKQGKAKGMLSSSIQDAKQYFIAPGSGGSTGGDGLGNGVPNNLDDSYDYNDHNAIDMNLFYKISLPTAGGVIFVLILFMCCTASWGRGSGNSNEKKVP